MTNGRDSVDRERDLEQHGDENDDTAEGDAQQNPQTSGDQQSVPEDPAIEVERQATGDRPRRDRS